MIEWWDKVDLEEDDNLHENGFLDSILEEAEEKRIQFTNYFSEFITEEYAPTAMSIEDKAYWEWSCVLINDNLQTLNVSLIFEFHERFKSVYTIEIILNTNKIYSTAGIVAPVDLPVQAFNELYKTIAFILNTVMLFPKGN